MKKMAEARDTFLLVLRRHSDQRRNTNVDMRLLQTFSCYQNVAHIYALQRSTLALVALPQNIPSTAQD